MATCDPKLLPAQATCFRCAEPGTLKQIQLYLLGVLSGMTSPNSLSVGATTYRPFQNKLALAAQVYLLTIITGQTSSPSALLQAARCWWCIPKSQRMNIETFLFATAAGTSTDPKVLARSMAPYRPLMPMLDQVKIFALNVFAGLTTRALMAGATCFMCVETGHLEEIYLYLLCFGVGTNLIPAGSIYTGAPPEFDLVVLANRSYVIIWGANDLSMTLCGVTITSSGVGTSTGVWTGSCTLMQFFGTFAGTSVTAKVIISPTIPPPPTGLAFTLDAAGNNLVYTWDAPTFASITGTEVWTSTDGTTYSLASTVAAPTTTFTRAAPALGAKVYVKIRWRGTFVTGFSSFSTPVLFDGAVSDWYRRVLVNGGAAVSANTVSAMATFVNSLQAASLLSLYYSLNTIVPDNLTAARTPLVVGTGGRDPWGNNGSNLVAGDLTVNGIVGNASNKWLLTGITLSLISNGGVVNPVLMGLSLYNTTGNNTANQTDIGICDAALEDLVSLAASNGANTLVGQLSRGTNGISSTSAQVNWTGYSSINRSSSTSLLLFIANSGVAHNQAGSNATAPIAASTVNPAEIFVLAANAPTFGTPNNPTNRRVSFAAIHQPFTLAQSLAQYNAIQALRIALGGGSV